MILFDTSVIIDAREFGERISRMGEIADRRGGGHGRRSR